MLGRLDLDSRSELPTHGHPRTALQLGSMVRVAAFIMVDRQF